MNEAPIPTLLTPGEWRLIWSLRELPESDLKRRLLSIIEVLVGLVHEPRCMEQQADGVPCPTPHTSCDECMRVTGILDSLATVGLEAARAR